MGFLDRFKHKCQHRWRDFDWYVSVSIEPDRNAWGDKYKGSVVIIEPYVCILCGERNDVRLESYGVSASSREYINSKVDELKKKYKDKIRDRAIVEDEVNDAIYIDRDFIETWNRLRRKEVSDVISDPGKELRDIVDELEKRMPKLEL